MALLSTTTRSAKKSGLIAQTVRSIKKLRVKPRYNVASTIGTMINAEAIIAQWWTRVPNNWGDALNPVLIEHLSGVKPILYSSILNVTNKPVYSVIGSTLGLKVNQINNVVVWGSGFMSEDSSFMVKPIKVCAVRGPLTRKKVLDQGGDCPEVYGDPALLYPLFYRPNVPKKYKLGVVPHYSDNDVSWLKQFEGSSEVIVIDILSGIDNVVDQICSCDLVASSSLHGLIAADAYNVPSVWVELSNGVHGAGFKFRDYFASVGRKDKSPLQIDSDTSLSQIYDRVDNYSLDIDLEALLLACPFCKRETLDNLMPKVRTQVAAYQ